MGIPILPKHIKFQFNVKGPSFKDIGLKVIWGQKDGVVGKVLVLYYITANINSISDTSYNPLNLGLSTEIHLVWP